MRFLKFYSVASTALIAAGILQRAVWLRFSNPTTHSIGYALTVLLLFWWLVSIFAAVNFKREGMSMVLPLAWVGYQILIIGSGILMRPLLDSNGTLDAVNTALMFVGDGGFFVMFAMLVKRLFTGSDKSDT